MTREFEIYNPNKKKVEELPVIYGFNNGGGGCFLSGVLLAEDGTALGGHGCSSEGYMLGDLGILKGSRLDRHESFKKHYPDGYKMDFVGLSEVKGHVGLDSAYKLNQEKAKIEQSAL